MPSRAESDRDEEQKRREREHSEVQVELGEAVDKPAEDGGDRVVLVLEHAIPAE